jgi:hypothetical protein
MSLFLAAVLIIGGLIAAVAVVIAVPVLFGLMAYDVRESRKNEVAVSTAAAAVAGHEATHTRIAVERGVARGFVLLGGLFWAVASFAGLYSFRESGVGNAVMAAFFPLVAVLVTLIVGWYYERITAVLLAGASLAVVAWGVIYQFEIGVWIIMTVALIGPMMTAAVLFWLARRDQEAYELATSTRPQLAPVFSARSSLGA